MHSIWKSLNMPPVNYALKIKIPSFFSSKVLQAATSRRE
jgi:hypothetical protein